MIKLNCEVITYANTGHVQQILTGLYLLKKQGIINLISKVENINSYDTTKEMHLRDSKQYHLQMILDGRIVVYFDLHDSYEIDSSILESVDIYFKRSYLNSYVEKIESFNSKKIFELGFNYWVYPNHIDIDNIKRSFSVKTVKGKVSLLLKALNLPISLTNSPKLKYLEELHGWKNGNNKKILFMARTWDPYDNPDRPKHKVEERKAINEFRASCIRSLTKEFGKDFSGGFSPTRYTLENYKDCVFPNSKLTTKNKYLHYLREFPICIASTGLHDSIGWKFGEYVAMSKAIVSEKLIYSLPKDFEIEKNYLDFLTPFELIEQTHKLYDNKDKRLSMMHANSEYYYKYLKPDVLVYNAILLALKII